jgi:ferric-dicitrate binding protein FerR (iron transport regulator)
MATELPPTNPDAAPATLEEQLVAYLDGELDVAESRRIEQLLATDPQVRQKLQALERTWELLDRLQSRALLPVRRRRHWLLAVGGAMVAALLGFLAVTLLRPQPNKRLLQDLPVLEHLEEYRQVESLKFLQTLSRDGAFDHDRAVVEE